jgi:hypothetical protein
MSGFDKVCHHTGAIVLIRLSAVSAAADAKEFTVGGEMPVSGQGRERLRKQVERASE